MSGKGCPTTVCMSEAYDYTLSTTAVKGSTCNFNGPTVAGQGFKYTGDLVTDQFCLGSSEDNVLLCAD
jgi:hypothetical protein